MNRAVTTFSHPGKGLNELQTKLGGLLLGLKSQGDVEMQDGLGGARVESSGFGAPPPPPPPPAANTSWGASPAGGGWGAGGSSPGWGASAGTGGWGGGSPNAQAGGWNI
jgi:hypothetical protein